MLNARNVLLSVSAISCKPFSGIVVFNYFEKEKQTLYEPEVLAEIEIVDVFDITFSSSRSVYELMSDDEENDLLDYLWMLKEDREC